MNKESQCWPIFVIGTGRSGTNWLGYTLAVHPEIRATVEAEPMFGWSVEMALDPGAEGRLLGKLIMAYRRQQQLSTPLHYLDKNHPNIWLAEKIKLFLFNARFLGIERNPYATVASMMVHKGVSAWHRRWKEFPVPNRFLGINENAVKIYDELSLATQCAMRWLSHHQRMHELEGILGKSIMVISYEAFVSSPEERAHELKVFLGLREPIHVPEVKKDSLNKWRTQLTTTDIRDINAVTGFPPDEVTEL